MSSRSDSETTITLTPPCSKGVAIRSSKRKSSMKKEKTGKKRRRLEYEVVALFKDKKMEEKFDGSFVNKVGGEEIWNSIECRHVLRIGERCHIS